MFVVCLRASVTSVRTALLLIGETLHGFDEVRDQIGAALILIEHFAPRGLGRLLVGRNVVDAAAGHGERCDDDREKSKRTYDKAVCSLVHDSGPSFYIDSLGNELSASKPRQPSYEFTRFYSSDRTNT